MLIGQFTYTACQSAGPYSATPGWKVKQAEPVPPATEIPAAAVQAAVRPFGVFTVPAVPALATQLQIDQLPRCLRLDVLQGGYRSLAHLAAAGRDHSGRDAFFAHGLMVSVATPGISFRIDGGHSDWGAVRPADLWGAAGWLTPYRAEAIEAAFVGEPPRPSAASPLNPERREDFVDLHPGQRAFVLAGAERMLTMRTPLVIVGLPVETAMWTSLITHLLLPSAGWSVAFSTYETGSSSDLLRPGGSKILGIPSDRAEDWHRITADLAVVHDPLRPPTREPAGFRLADGSVLAVGRWAELAERVCAADLEGEVRGAIDGLGERVAGGLDDWPLIGLPAAVLALPRAQLDSKPAIAGLAAQVVIEHFPLGYHSEPALLDALVDAVFHWSADSIAASEQILRSLDNGPDASNALIDRLLAGYVSALLRSPNVFALDRPPWIPHRLHLSAPAADRLLVDLAMLIDWVDHAGAPMTKARLLLTVASLAQQWGWLGGGYRLLVHRLLGERSRAWVVQVILGSARQGSLPPIPGWLWDDVLVDELQNRLAEFPPGSVLADPLLRSIVDRAAGPLPPSYVPGETLRSITLVDGERAAAVLLAPATDRQPAISPAQDEVLRVAAFLRSVATANGVPRVAPDRLFAELRRWFPDGQPRAVVLIDLLEQLQGTVAVESLCAFAVAALASLPPDSSTAAVAWALVKAGARPDDLRNTVVEWHAQFGQPVTATSREVDVPTKPLSRPDFPETRLLDVLSVGRLPSALSEAGSRRLARWVLVLAAEMLELPGNAAAMEQLRWLRQAAREPLSGRLESCYRTEALKLIADLDPAGPGSALSADVLAAEWVVRSRLAELGVGTDPARSFFEEPADRGAWADGIRALLRPETRTRDDLSSWVQRVRRSADGAARAAQLPLAADDGRQALVEVSVETATRLASLPGLFGRMRRSSGRRDGQ